MASVATASWEDQISMGLCSTHPGFGYIWVNSFCAMEQIFPCLSKIIHLELVVPWSNAIIYFFIPSSPAFSYKSAFLVATTYTPVIRYIFAFFKPRIRIRLRSETELFNKRKSSRTIFEDVILLYFEFKNGSKFLVLKKKFIH
jgi:hypothetical protein